MDKALQDRILSTTKNTKFGLVLRCALAKPNEVHTAPAFSGKASITSDGYCLCDYVSADGDLHHGAFVGGWSEVKANTVELAKHLALEPTEATELHAVITGWIGSDYRPAPAQAAL